ncbi:TetR family transcriptional regulator C-terminal domain-containing protein [Pseudomonas sp. J452]|uniref:TetR family transcriptional regulator C-terminal domain-containing protein n=1 Tax=Pseudomonas sp. J452 TaxID=2898441 RepID=UPI0021AE309A|nr:TetR family transcriptional regulator C-terminal domain-containing protein [Pseudomonas sp. J452]UUY10330.1 TetR family transcriptional regulator C-terminal domain-containing protein [Pseudomonas sp. J452]
MTSMESTRPKPKRSSEPRVRETVEVRRKSLIQAAMRSIAKYGYAGSTIDKICSEAQVSRGLINHHFQSKDELIRQAYRELCEEWSFQTRDMLLSAERDPEDKMRSIIRASFGPALFKHDYIGIWVGFVSVIAKSPTLKRLNRELIAEDIVAYQKIFEAIAAKRGKTINARLATITLLAMIDGFWTQWYLDPSAFTGDEAAQACSEYVERLYS